MKADVQGTPPRKESEVAKAISAGGQLLQRWPIIRRPVLLDNQLIFSLPKTALVVDVMHDPSKGTVTALYVGHSASGPLVALYCDSKGGPGFAEPLWSQGDFGRNPASGGNFSKCCSEVNRLATPPAHRWKPTLRQAIIMRLDRSGFSPKRLQSEPEELTEHLRKEFARLDWAMPRDLAKL